MAGPPERPGDPTESIADGLDRVFRHLVLLGGILALTFVIVLAYLVTSVRPDHSRYRGAGRALDQAHAAMVDQQTGLRGYLLLDDRRYLEAYHSGVRTVDEQGPVLSRNLGSDERLAPLLLEMRVAQQAWESEWAATAITDRAPTDRTALSAFHARGKQLFDRYRETHEELRDRLWSRRDTLHAREGWIMSGALGVTVLLGTLGLVLVVHHRRRLKEAVVEPVGGILAATEAIARHDLGVELEPSGPTEFRRIGESINSMRAALIDAGDQARVAQDQLGVQAEQLRAILAMSREISGSLNLRYVLRTVATSAIAVSAFERAIVWLSDEDAGRALSPVYDTAGLEGRPEDLDAEVGAGVVGQAVRYGRTVTENATEESSVEVRADRGQRTVALPLVVGGRVRGAIELSSEEPTPLGEGSLDVLETLAIHAAAAIEAASLHSHTEELAHTDGLTGLANRRRLDHDLALECERSARYQRSLAVIMFDVDHFKRFNDRFGHARGDEILQQLAEVVRDEIRSTDSVYRYGGEEFTVLARETDGPEAVQLAERLRSGIERHFSARGSVGRVTASFGVAVVPPERPEAASLIAAADAALYRSKAAGRNRVTGPVEPEQVVDGTGPSATEGLRSPRP